MQLEQGFTLPASCAQAWPAFQDVALLVECLPGASLTGPAVDGEWPLRFDIKLGPIAAAFVGSGRVSFEDTARHGRFEGQAVDKRTQSRVKGAARFALQDTAEGCEVKLAVDYSLSGSLAQFGRGAIVKELAGALTQQFAANLAARLQVHTASVDAAAPASIPAQSAPAAPPTAATPPPATQPLSALGLVGLAFKAWWQRWLLRLRGRSPR